MARNLELKARIGSAVVAERIARGLSARRVGTLHQKDTFLLTGTRRLKIREERGKTPELIYYARPDTGTSGGRLSRYVRVPLRSSRRILRVKEFAQNDQVKIRKTRTLFLYENARIHIDVVRNLGTFIEFEVLITRGRAQADRLLRALVEEFGIETSNIVSGAYADMLQMRLQP